MLSPSATEWDEYFALCNSGRDLDIATAVDRIAKLRQCRDGVKTKPVPEIDQLRGFLRNNQLCELRDIVSCTEMGHDRVKDVLFNNRELFFVFRANAMGDSKVRYSVLEDLPANNKGDRIQMVHWMRIKGFIDPHYFHQPLNRTPEKLCEILDSMEYPKRITQIGDRKRMIYFVR